MNNLNLKTIIICLLGIGKLNAQTDISAEWLRHTCGYTDGEHLLGGDVWGDAVCADDFGIRIILDLRLVIGL